MRIYFSELETLKGKPKKIRFTFSFLDVIKENREIKEITPIDFDGEAKYSAGMIEVQGDITFSADFYCSRCLNQFQESFTVPFKEHFAKERASSSEGGEELDEVHWIHEESFDLTSYCKEVIILALPYIPVCDVECKGLCPVCGNNRNEGECGCRVERIDPRLADLAKLLNQDEG